MGGLHYHRGKRLVRDPDFLLIGSSQLRRLLGFQQWRSFTMLDPLTLAGLFLPLPLADLGVTCNVTIRFVTILVRL